ncbi:hypothetical protein TWF106_008161 [Orbilia oligospora]|uniref:NACHT domain-containing protein n=1 Tax=Orbilia oligospora TaxID=2813651 RepID=A0A7C8QM54_ORBOL|nr:hypothetical protein TWF106_008161 [Orbilia oligospora]
MSEPRIQDYTVGWICALQEEYHAATRMCDQRFSFSGVRENEIHDENTYFYCRIGGHNVIIVCLPYGRYGTSAAATTAGDMVRSFPNLKFALMVGIGGGAPTSKNDIRLGDVVVGVPNGKCGGVVQYDFGKRLSNGLFQQSGQLNAPPGVLLKVIPEMIRLHQDPLEPDRIAKHISLMDDMPEFMRPSEDKLYRSSYQHVSGKISMGGCDECADDELEERPVRQRKRAVTVHYGTIASANSVMKDAVERNKYANSESNILCFEMEAGGLMNNFPCLIIRGICDYSDSHKNDNWHNYAALAAAAYAKELLCVLTPEKIAPLEPWDGVHIEKLLGELHSEVSGIATKAELINRRQQSQEEEKMLDWLTLIDYAPRQSDHIGRRGSETGQWFLDSHEFQEWHRLRAETLFCPGIPGAGKTTLSSIAINYLLEEHDKDPTIGVSYIYFDFRRGGEQKIDSLLLSLLKQLAQTRPHCSPDAVKDLYFKHQKTKTRPLQNEVIEALRSVVALYTRVFFIVDALDECQTDDDCRKKLLEELLDLQRESGANILVTSRPIPEITGEFKKSRKLKIRAHDEDINKYLNGRMRELPRFVAKNSDLKERIIKSISGSVDGMFLLARLHMDSLIGKKSVASIKKLLSRLSAGHGSYDQAYNDAMERVVGQRTDHAELAKQTLSWIVCSKRPLNSSELLHALAVEIDDTELDEENISDIEFIVSVCCGLVTVEKESGTWSNKQNGTPRLIHYTTQEYLQRERMKWFPNADAEISTVCTTYLSFSAFGSGFCSSDSELKLRMQLNPLYDYATRNWGHHARDMPAAANSQAVIKFLRSASNVEAAAQAVSTKRMRERYPGLLKWGATDHDDSQSVPRGVTALHLVAYFGADNIVNSLLVEYNPDIEDSYQQTPVMYASRYGNATTVTLLLERGADPEKRDMYGRTALLWASKNGYELIVDRLLQTGRVRVDAEDKYGLQSLHWAAWGGYVAVASLLLSYDADTETRAKNGITPLVFAVEGNSEAVARLLVRKGAQPNFEYRIETVFEPLERSYSDLRESTSEDPTTRGFGYLLKPREGDGEKATAPDKSEFYYNWRSSRAMSKTHINFVWGVFTGGTKIARTPLFRAAEKGLDGILDIIEESGVKAGSANDIYRLMTLESFFISDNAVKKLLTRAARVYGIAELDPVFLAVASGSKEEAIRLLNSGRNVNVKCAGYNLTPLDAAVYRGDTESVQLLVENGAMCTNDSIDLHGRTLLHRAVQRTSIEIIQLLIDHGASVDIQDDDHCTPLFLAAGGGKKELVELMLRNGASIDSRDINGNTGLFLAISRGNQEMIQFLLDHGSQINLKRKDDTTPLFFALCHDSNELVELLLRNGADVHLPTWGGWTPLEYAASCGNTAFLKLILAAENVELDRKDSYGSTLLSKVVRKGNEEVVRMLLATNAVNLQSEDAFGRSIIWWAKRQGHHNIAHLLIEDAKRRGIILPDVDVPLRNRSGLDEARRTCDICRLNMLKNSAFYHCRSCDDGDFELCLDCVEVGAHCLDESHEIVRMGESS